MDELRAINLKEARGKSFLKTFFLGLPSSFDKGKSNLEITNYDNVIQHDLWAIVGHTIVRCLIKSKWSERPEWPQVTPVYDILRGKKTIFIT